MTRLIDLLAMVVVLSGLTLPEFAQEAQPTESMGGVAAELSRLNSTLNSIHELLTKRVETQHLGLLFKRAEFAAGRVGELEGQLRRAKSERRSFETEIEKGQLQIEEMSMAVGNSGSPFDALPPESLGHFIRQMEAALERPRDTLREVSNEIRELESQLSKKRVEVREWEDLLDELLATQF